ncbi:DUF1788 domain-containing protein [Zhongshania sp. BJYM1]|uniref:DUF1788 domain-containing protein n=1 Tax=Zhongshania aquatica TaxID=2965069 RepID=UPI0022B30299|nr:DUF1788 domain-containing protein [Marortus sp. BJYM1]
MDASLNERLNQIPAKILADEFLKGHGLGNEIGFWVFDYQPETELQVREYIAFLEDMLAKKHAHLPVVHINLLSALIEYLKDRGFIDKAINLQRAKGDDALLSALKGPLHMDKFVPYLNERYQADKASLVLMSGVGSVWPMIRAHNILNRLHSVLGHVPLVLFYPGQYDGQSMSLFGRIPSNNYYRAFKLVP